MIEALAKWWGVDRTAAVMRAVTEVWAARARASDRLALRKKAASAEKGGGVKGGRRRWKGGKA